MDRRSFCKVLGFAAGSTLLPGLMVQAIRHCMAYGALPGGLAGLRRPCSAGWPLHHRHPQ